MDNNATKLSINTMSNIKPTTLKYLWPGRIPLGKLSLLVGEPGSGKSLSALDIASRTSTGAVWPDGEPGDVPADVLLIANEDDASDTLAPRLLAAGANMERVHLVNGVTRTSTTQPVNLLNDVKYLEDALDSKPNVKLLIIDPITSYLGRADADKNSDIRNALMPLADLAARRGIAIIALSHLNKASDKAPGHRVIGSIGFMAVARAVWCVAKDARDITGQRRLFLPLKANLGPDTDGLAFRVVADEHGRPSICWDGPANISAADAFAPPRHAPGPAPYERREATAWLKTLLTAGPMPTTDVEDAAQAQGFSESTLRRARRELGVEPHRPVNPGPWMLSLPTANPQEASTCAT